MSVFYPQDISVSVDILLLCLILLALVCAILLPILFRFGYAKAKYPFMLLIIAIGSSTPLFVSDTMNEGLNNLMSYMSTRKYLMLFVCSLIIVYGSIILSIAFFKKKEV